MTKLTFSEQQAARKLEYFRDKNDMWVFDATLPPEAGALVIRAIEAAVAGMQEGIQIQKRVGIKHDQGRTFQSSSVTGWVGFMNSTTLPLSFSCGERGSE